MSLFYGLDNLEVEGMKNKILWIVTFLPMVVTIIAIQFMEDKVPMHYNVAGEIDRWGSKYENFIFPVLIILTTLVFYALLKRNKKKQISEQNEKKQAEVKNDEKLIRMLAIGMALMFGVMHYFILFTAFVETKKELTEYALDINVVSNVTVGLLIIFIGNILPKAKEGSVAVGGIIWDDGNDKALAATNRMGGKIFIGAGILIIIEALLIGGIASSLLMIAIVISAGIASSIYSYTAYQKYK